MRKFWMLVSLLAAPNMLFAQESKVGDLVIDHPFAKATPPSAMTGSGYLRITNEGHASDRLIAVEADFPRVEIHASKVENDIASMFQIEATEILPGETVTFAPRGMHIMFMGLNGDPFEEGEVIPVTLVFEIAGSIDVGFSVETLENIMVSLGVDTGAMGEMDHGDDDHSNH